MSRRTILVGLLLAAALLGGALAYGLPGRAPDVSDSAAAGRAPRIHPDYAGVVLPPNIAPTRFCVDEPGGRYVIVIAGKAGTPVRVCSASAKVRIPVGPWRALLSANRGGAISFDVYVRGGDSRWQRFEPVTATIAREDVDPFLVYRLIDSAYNLYFRMRLVQRDLRSFEESVVLRSDAIGEGCMNCHTFLNNSGDRMILHFRGGPSSYGSGMLIAEGKRVQKVDTRTRFGPGVAGFTAWHPSGEVVVFSMNSVRQFFHTARAETRDVVDMDSNIAMYVPATQSVTSTAAFCDPARLETWPAWSPDGKYLYFCSAPMLWTDRDKVPPERYREIRYDLMRIGFDISTRTWGRPETFLSADKTGLSITQPRVSPDGRFLAFCMSAYSTFPSFQESSDLYLMDLRTGRYERMSCSSERSESWHSWSSNSRWLAFSSKRDDGQSIRAYFAYVDESGKAAKPFVLPQEDPAFYDSFVDLFQLPELTRSPVAARGEAIAAAVRSGRWEKAGPPATSASPLAGSSAAGPAASPGTASDEPWQSPR